jgi:hypothetical protein
MKPDSLAGKVAEVRVISKLAVRNSGFIVR